jgi:hypothetical protein
LLLLGDSNVARGASPKTALAEKLTQILQRLDINMRRAERHLSAGDCIQHPIRQHDDHAGGGFDITQPSAVTQLDAMQAHPLAEQRVPAIVNFDFAPNTGRMSGRL